MRRTLKVTTLTALASGLMIVAAVGPATPAGASCAGDPSLARAIAAGGPMFVGTVVSTTNGDRWATFAVDEVWSGDVADVQVVKAGPPPTGDPESFSASSVDRTYQAGVRYLVDASTAPGPFDLKPGELADTNCSATTAWVDADAALRPAGARTVTHDPGEVASAMGGTDGSGSTSGWAVAAGVAAVAVIVAVALWLLFRRGSIADRARTDVPEPDDDHS